jgi:hypothetical protein
MGEQLKLASMGIDKSSHCQFELILQTWKQLKVLIP